MLGAAAVAVSLPRIVLFRGLRPRQASAWRAVAAGGMALVRGESVPAIAPGPEAAAGQRDDRELARVDRELYRRERITSPLTVAIPSYNGRSLLEKMLPSLAAQTLERFDVLVVDDGSEDGTADWLGERWPEIELIEHGRNRGITAALNTCLSTPQTKLVALLNNDLELDPRFLEELVRAMEEYPQAGSAVGKLLDYHRRQLLDGAGDVLLWRGHGHRRGHGEPDFGQYDNPQAIFGACAGAAVYRRATLLDVGLFDETFEAFFEDVDWSLRAQVAGYDCRYVPTAVAYHMGSATVGEGLGDFTRYHLWRNGPWLIVKGLPLRLLARHLHQLALGQAINFAVAVRDRKLLIWWEAWRDALRGMPAILAKRRALQGARRRTVHELAAIIDDQAPAEAKGRAVDGGRTQPSHQPSNDSAQRPDQDIRARTAQGAGVLPER